MLDLRHRHGGQPRAFGQCARFSQGAAGWQLQVDLRLRPVRRGYKPGGQQRHERDRADKKRGSAQGRGQPVVQAPFDAADVGAHQAPVVCAFIGLSLAQNVLAGF